MKGEKRQTKMGQPGRHTYTWTSPGTNYYGAERAIQLIIW